MELEDTYSAIVNIKNHLDVVVGEYERVCAEWNDVEIALSDIRHYQEFLTFTEEGKRLLDIEVQGLLKERRALKYLYTQMEPHIKEMAELKQSLSELRQVGAPKERVYGVRSHRGYNVLSNLLEHTEKEEDAEPSLFCDNTGTEPFVRHIYHAHTENPNLLTRKMPKVLRITNARMASERGMTLTELNELQAGCGAKLLFNPAELGHYSAMAHSEARKTFKEARLGQKSELAVQVEPSEQGVKAPQVELTEQGTPTEQALTSPPKPMGGAKVERALRNTLAVGNRKGRKNR